MQMLSRHAPASLRAAALATLAACAAHSPAWAHAAERPVQLDEVTIESVNERSNQRAMRKGALREDIVMTETVGARAIEKSGAANVNEAVDKNPGIAVQTECSICNVRNVLLNNLPGRYTTLMVDGIPIYSSVSNAYGLDSVALYGLERIDIARGAGASLIAPEALSGTINLVTKRPTRAENIIQAQVGNFGQRRLDAFMARPLNGGAVTASVHADRHLSVDGNGDGISEYTGYRRYMAGLGWFIDDVGGFKLRGRLDLVDEKRGGGALGTDYANIQNNMDGNPFDFSRGPLGSPDRNGWINPEDGSIIPYEAGRGGMSEIIFTKRAQMTTSAERRLADNSRVRLSLGVAQHKQDSFYEGDLYDAKQRQYYLDANYQFPVHGGWLLTAGASYRYEDLKSQGVLFDGNVQVNGLDNYVFRTPGVYIQGYKTFFDDKLELNTSLRVDRHNEYGNIVSPRLNALWHHSPMLSSRLSLGKGFRAPTSFFEQDHGILSTTRIIREVKKAEESQNLSYALNFADDRLAFTASYNFNRIKNMAMLDSGAEVDGQPVTIFSSSEKPVTVQGLDFNLSYQLTPALTVSGGAEFSKYKFDEGTLVFARPNHRFFAGVDYESGPWDLTARVTVTGPMDLKKFYGEDVFNFNGSRKREKSPTFATVDVRGQYSLNKNVSLYMGVDNLFDYKQIDKENFLWVNGKGEFDVTYFWGPSRGRFIYAGAKFEF